MTTLYLSAAAGLLIRVELPDGMTVPPEWPLLAAAYVTGAVPVETAAVPEITLTLEEAKTYEVTLVRSHCTMRGPWGGVLPDDAYHVLHTLARAAWLERNLYAAHAACVRIGGRTILLAGPSGSGKTTVALRLMAQGAEVFSGNTTLLDFADGDLLALGGTTVITLRAGTMDEARFKDAVRYGGRVAAYFPDPPTGPFKVDAVAYLRLNDGVEEARQLTPESALHTLYPLMLDAMNTSILVGLGCVVSPGLPTGAHEKLADRLGKLVPGVPVWHLAGSLAFITQQIESL